MVTTVETAIGAALAHVGTVSELEFHYTPKHAGWLNLVEIEIGVLRTMCLDRHIEQRAVLETEIATWERRRNASREKIQ
jgi:DDE superfamily endonuclease